MSCTPVISYVMELGMNNQGVAMDLCPVEANFCMEYFEHIYRFVDDTLLIWLHGFEKSGKKIMHLNNLHQNIQFML